ncbi:MAG: enolase [Candidatus Thermoplasmatota archaeon]|nr:enolase [Candidatus Thermoplasmatota archaeon]MCL5665915.1 enolase [Candidatus Thermoplasmatota archaeon]
MSGEFEIVNADVRNILDSRGKMTVEAEIYLPGSMGRCSAPAGASTGKTEVTAFPDGSAKKSVDFFNTKVKHRIEGLTAIDQIGFDRTLKEIDGTDNFSNMGGNLSTALSIANAKAVANQLGLPLYMYVGGGLNRHIPRPIGNVLGGGKHSKNGTTIQEFLVSSDTSDILTCIFTNSLVHARIGEMLEDKFPKESIGLGDEKAWTAPIQDSEAFEIVRSAAREISSQKKIKIDVGSDFAASTFYQKGKYVYRERKLSKGEQIDYVKSVVKDFGLYFLEDPMDENDFEGFAEITKAVGNKTLVVGDDLYTTNPERVRKGVEMKSTNAVLIKVNQIGTLSSTYETVRLATENSMKTVISHRSGETTDDFIAHLGVAFGSHMIKSGTIGGERLAKLNELVRIQEDFRE